jgi:hypothetical protein
VLAARVTTQSQRDHLDSPKENSRTLGFPATLMEFGAPSALQLRRIHSSPVCLTGYVPPTGFLTLTTAFSSPERPALFHAGNAHGVLLFRDFPSQPGPDSFRYRMTLSAFLRAFLTVNHQNARRLARTDLSACSPNHSSPTGLCSGCESVLREGFYTRNPTADSLLSFFASPGYYPDLMATSCITCSLMRFSSLTAHEPSSKLVDPRLDKQAALQRIHHQARDSTLTSEISPPEVLWPSITIDPKTNTSHTQCASGQITRFSLDARFRAPRAS